MSPGNYPALFVRVGFTCGGVILASAFGFAGVGIAFAITMELLSVVFGALHTVDAVNRAFASTPWGAAAYLTVGMLCAGGLAGAWIGWQSSGRLFALLPVNAFAAAPAACIVFGFVLFFYGLFYFPVPVRLTVNHATTVGHLLRPYPENHATVSYVYIVEGRKFERIGNPEKFDTAAVGDAVTVFYSPKEPGLSLLWTPKDLLIHNFLDGLMVSAFLSLAPFFQAAVRRWAASLPTSRSR